MDMFDNYQNLNPNDFPNNEFKELPCRCNHIVAGGTSTLVFEVPISFADGLLSTLIVFNQAERLIMVKNPSEITFDDKSMYVTITLGAEESAVFGGTNLDTLVQVKLSYENKVLYTEVMKIKVLEVLKTGLLTD